MSVWKSRSVAKKAGLYMEEWLTALRSFPPNVSSELAIIIQILGSFSVWQQDDGMSASVIKMAQNCSLSREKLFVRCRQMKRTGLLKEAFTE